MGHASVHVEPPVALYKSARARRCDGRTGVLLARAAGGMAVAVRAAARREMVARPTPTVDLPFLST